MTAPGVTGRDLRILAVELRWSPILAPGSGIGILLDFVGDDAHHTVTVRDGSINNWGTGATSRYTVGHQTVVVENVDFTGNGAALIGYEVPDFEVHRSRFEGNGNGVSVWSAGATVSRSVFVDNRTALTASNAGGFRISHSTIASSDIGLRCSDGGAVIHHSRLEQNGTALWCWLGSGEVTHSTFAGNDRGIYLFFETYFHVEKNTFSDNGVGIEMGYLDHSQVVRNTFRGNGTGFLCTPPIDAPPASTTLETNRFSRNGDGIYTTQAEESWSVVRLAGNTADHNTGWGIYVEQAEDLGGNVARHNGNEPQCFGVEC